MPAFGKLPAWSYIVLVLIVIATINTETLAKKKHPKKSDKTAPAMAPFVCTSSLPEAERVDCAGDVTPATEGICRSRSCVWCPTTTVNIPYCFYDNSSVYAYTDFLKRQCPSCSYCPFAKDCYPEPGASQAVCWARGCQWCDYPSDEISCGPKCMYGGTNDLTLARLTCPNCTYCTTRIDCHPEPDADAGRCLSRGCRWCPLSNQPYCIHSDVLNLVTEARLTCKTCATCATRVDCHPEADATSAKCVAKNCLWCETTEPNQPFCVFGGSTSPYQNTCVDCGNCTTKVACGPPGVTSPSQLQCITYGCMWCPMKSFSGTLCVHRLY